MNKMLMQIARDYAEGRIPYEIAQERGDQIRNSIRRKLKKNRMPKLKLKKLCGDCNGRGFHQDPYWETSRKVVVCEYCHGKGTK